jgi:hypothetical protein
MNYWLLFIPILSAITGWICTRIAWYVIIYKVIPTHKASIANSIGKSVAEAFSFADLERKITDPQNIKKIMPVVEVHIDDFLRNKLKEKMPVISMFIGSKTIDSLKEVFLKEIEDLFPVVLKQFAGNLQAELNVEAMAANKITNVSANQLNTAASPAFRYFQLFGAIAGLVIGAVNLLVFWLLS